MLYCRELRKAREDFPDPPAAPPSPSAAPPSPSDDASGGSSDIVSEAAANILKYLVAVKDKGEEGQSVLYLTDA